MNEQTILHPDQADDLHRLLGTVEDWLLHASVETLDELGGLPCVGPRPAPFPHQRRRGNGIVVNELISTRIHDHATRLALPHLAKDLDGLLARAEADNIWVDAGALAPGDG
jgi:hypothetical protein